jgi:hypothetical protein
MDWNGGLETYLRSATTPARGWASMAEVPYVTLFPGWDAGRVRTWADRAFVLSEDVGVLADVKAVRQNGTIGPTIEDIPVELAALVATDWPQTRQQDADELTEAGWVRRVRGITSPWIVEVLAVWGDAPLGLDIRRELGAGLERGIARLRRMMADGKLIRLPDRVETVLTASPDVVTRRRLGSKEMALFAWISPIRAGDPTPRTA